MAKTQKDTLSAAAPAENQTPSAHPGRLNKYTFRFALLIIIGGVGYFAWQNPVLKTQIHSWFAPAPKEDLITPRITDLQNQITGLQDQINSLAFRLENSGLGEIREQIRNLEKINLNIIDSKADAAAVLGVVTRMDSAEQKITKLSEVTDSSALLLTGILLVKDAADRGQTFEYEAEVLTQLADNSSQTAPYIAAIRRFAATGLPSDLELSLEYNHLLQELRRRQAQQNGQTWTERLNNKLNEIVKIKKTGINTPEADIETTLDETAALINNNDLLRAAKRLKGSNLPQIEDLAGFQNWIAKVEQREEFYRAVSALSADALAALKVNNLRKVRGK